jgi:phenylpropionate dioxygenase-like ring-hydroxylating dioxygenase large terminal subunit
MFIRNEWYIAAWGDEIEGDKPLPRRICGESIVLFRDASGRVGALFDRCCHRGAPLQYGCVTELGLQCGYHGLVFDRTGICVRIPGQERIPARAKVQSYPIVEKDGFVWIWMGEAARADTDRIIDYPFHNDSVHWPHKHTMYPIKGNYMLMVDNLMDLTHLGYVHTSTIGGNPAIHVEAEMQTEPKPNGLRFIRWMRNSVPPPTYLKAVSFQGRIDRWQEFEYVAPSHVLQVSGAVDAGGGDTAYANGIPKGGLTFRLFHGLTPETEESCHYFWSVANGYRQHEPQATDQLFSEIAAAFQEDKRIVEAQQARLSETSETGLVDIVTDKARLHMRRVVEGRLAEEVRQTVAAE